MFQSSPAPRGGRYSGAAVSPAQTYRFNPRPPRGAGATYPLKTNVKHCVCFNPRPPRGAGATTWCTGSFGGNQQFQSSPAPRGGRYRAPGEGGAIRRVSILARPEGRALQRQRYLSIPRIVFQSSPAPRGGRYLGAAGTPAVALRFQSSPAPRGGRYVLISSMRVEISVSILARPEGRALPTRRRAHNSHRLFQSSPAPRGGRYPMPTVWRSADNVVSILARPEGRALPVVEPPAAVSLTFQSSPAPRGGRYRDTVSARRLYESFNPRPPRGAGATNASSFTQHNHCVSILARPEGRALP